MSRLHDATPGAAGEITPEARAQRILGRLDVLFEIGRAAGTNREGFGPGEQQAFELVAGWMQEAGLEVAFDAAGNVAGRLRGSDPELPEVWSGSHLDTPPDGGRFDGALGTLLALDVAEAMTAGRPPRRTVAVMAFRLEESPRFGVGCFGSRALCGGLEDGEGDLLDADGVSLAEAFAALGYGELPTAGWLEPAPACFVEAHIEQGPALAAAGAPLGIVTSIAAMAGFELTFKGRRGHAGTVPMTLRSDALGAAAHLVVAAHGSARCLPGAVATIGRLTVAPGATNTIPDRCRLFADLRAPDSERLDALVDRVLAAAADAAVAADCTVVIEPRWRSEAEAMHPVPRAALERAVTGLGVELAELPSGAGHDAQILAAAGVPSAMLFVRSDAGGVSHAPEEHTGADAVVLAVRALEAALRELAGA
ncbi:MAG: allantoate deiminase [Solirubrobacteraceae bacterium]|nr:allantoate deiminase [Solirubrobacteraceae bacterium]